MESSPPTTTTTSPATPEEQALITKYLGTEGVIIDSNFKSTAVLKETEAHRRKELISDVEYQFALALKHGDHYLGQASITFYLEQHPVNDEELFIESQALAIAELRINGTSVSDPTSFINHRIPLKIG